MQSIRIGQAAVSIWVRADEEDLNVFRYRAVSETGDPPRCDRASASSDDRSNWRILASSALALPACTDRNGSAAQGTLYRLQRAS